MLGDAWLLGLACIFVIISRVFHSPGYSFLMLLGDKIPTGRIVPVSAASIEVLLPGTTSPWGASPPPTAPMDIGREMLQMSQTQQTELRYLGRSQLHRWLHPLCPTAPWQSLFVPTLLFLDFFLANDFVKKLWPMHELMLRRRQWNALHQKGTRSGEIKAKVFLFLRCTSAIRGACFICANSKWAVTEYK